MIVLHLESFEDNLFEIDFSIFKKIYGFTVKPAQKGGFFISKQVTESAFAYNEPKQWNELPSSIRDSTSHETFKNVFGKYLQVLMQTLLNFF